MIVIPFGGISNRLKCIISAVAEHDDITLKWEIPTTGGGIRCNFDDLFTNLYLGDGGAIIKDCKFIHDEMNTHNSGDKGNISEVMKAKYISVIEDLTPTEYIMREVDRLFNELPNNYSTVSVRTFRSFKEEYQSWGQHFKLNLLFNELDTIDNQFLLTCDDRATLEQIKSRYGDKVITTPKRTEFGDFRSVKGMEDIMIDLLLGGKGNKIYGTAMSSFSEMQWWMGKCKANYKQMKLHVK